MSSVNPKRRAPNPGQAMPVPTPPPGHGRSLSDVPSRAPVRWADAEDFEGEAWHADWDGEEAGDDAELDVMSDPPEVADSVVPSEVDDAADAELDDSMLDDDEDEEGGEQSDHGEDEDGVSAGARPHTAADRASGTEDEDGGPGSEKRRGRRRSKTIARKQMLRERRRMLAQGTIPEIVDYDRPIRRSECREGKRPCLYVSCRYHLYLDVNPMTGSIKLNFPDKEVWELEETCALDVAERGGITLEEVGDIMNLTRERIRQVEVSGLEKLKHGDVELHTFIDGRELELAGFERSKSLPILED